MAKLLALLATAVLAGCQSWSTVEFAVPMGSEPQVRQVVQDISSSVGLLPCAEWGVRVKGSEDCFGGRVGSNSITVVTQVGAQTYLVKVGVYSDGLYDKSAFEALERRYGAALQQLFQQRDVVRSESRTLLGMS
jgi:hypothetical protein